MKRADRKKVRFASDKQTVSPVKITKGAGIMILAKDTGRVLFLKRSPSSNHPETWDLPGGHTDDAEAPEQTARRETREEIGVNVTGEITQMSDTTNEDVNFVTFYHECRTEFTPKLDLNEHTEYVWAFPSDPPTPLHPGVKLTLDTELAKDANPLSIAAVRLGHKGGLSTSPAKVAASRMNGAQHGHDAEGDHWITSKNDHHILLDGSGKVKAGAGGTLKGETLSGAKSSKSEPAAKSSEKSNVGLQPKLSATEKSRLASYTGDAFLKINTDLRNGVESPDSKALDSIVAKGTIAKGATLYRGMTKDAFKEMMGGDTVNAGMELSDKAFMSTSTAPDGAAHRAGGVKLQIEVSDDQHGIDVSKVSNNPHENEVILPRNTKLVVTSISPGKNAGDPHVVKVKTVSATAKHGSDAALAFDKASNRSYDVDGRLKVEQSNISRAMVCDYLGSEIPDSELLGLDPNKIYKLFRDPDELAKAAHTFNNIQLLSEHVPVSTVDIQKDLIIGCTGTDTIFEFPFLKNSLCVWTKDGIDRVENKEAQEISCSYRYVADMTPGEFEGTAYDAVMREIHGNHVILTPAGRCGPTVIVGDAAPLSRINQPSKLEKITMSQTLSKKALRVKGVLTAVLQPQFAADKMPNLDIILADVDHKNWLAKKPLILAALKSHMAADADPKPLSGLLDSQDKDAAEDADPIEGILAHCRGKLSDDDLGELESKVRALSPAKKAEDADEDDKKAEDEDDEDKKDEEKDVKEADTVSKKAMDAAIKLAQDATIARINGVHEARKIASPFVGEIALACDSAEDVYRAALKVLNVDVKDIHPSALRTILELQPNPNAKREPVFAGDAAVPAGLDKFLADMGLPA